MDFFLTAGYLKYFIFSRHRKGHGLHSPFLYNLVSEIFRNKIEPDIVSNIEKTRKKLLSDHRFITINDPGAGSRMMKTSQRRISDIVKYSAVPAKYGNLISNLAATCGSRTILELGTSLGISSMYLASQNKEAKVITIEGCKALCVEASENIKQAGFTNISVVNGSFDDTLRTLSAEGDPPGIVFIDGDHRKESVLRNFKKITEFTGPGTVVIIDDINYSRDMAEAWSEIKRDPLVTLSVDVFRLGVLFFRQGITSGNYVIRY